eukprot:11177985-Lingulodinium_polyedra.AAC.1
MVHTLLHELRTETEDIADAQLNQMLGIEGAARIAQIHRASPASPKRTPRSTLAKMREDRALVLPVLATTPRPHLE